MVCCRPSELQTNLYNHFLRSNSARRMLSAAAAAAEGGGGGAKKGGASALTAINALRKLCGHPKLIYDLIHPPSGKLPAEADGFKVQLVSFLTHTCFLGNSSTWRTFTSCR